VIPTIQWVGPPPSSNFHVGRDGTPITLIVDHWMAGTIDAALARFMNPTSIVSAHYLIGQDGRIFQLVKDEDTAYHAGDYGVNLRSIGIEHEASPTVPPSNALYAASARLHTELGAAHGFALVEGVTVKPHRAIVPTQCPGTLDLGRIILEATAGGNMPPSYVGQSVTDINIAVGEVAMADAIYNYGPKGNRTFPIKVVGRTPGVAPLFFYPPADPDADPTLEVSSRPAIFVVSTRAT
jgi:hypothetical protein